MLMQLLAERQKRGARPTVKEGYYPAPIGGWNARDAVSAMDIKDALKLDNWIVDEGEVRIRPGSTSHATGISGNYVESLMEYAPPSGTNKMFAAGPTDIYDVTSAGAVGAASVASMANGRWQHVMFANASGNYLYIVNGADDPRYYDGSSWTVPAITGVTQTNLVNVSIHGNRLWFTEKNTMKVWYLATSAITGAATELNLAPFARKGGYLVGTWSWPRDGGDGPDDYFVGITSKGEVIVYQGTDPASAGTFQLVGVFQIGEPIGRRCVVKAGADLAVITSQGLIALTQVTGLNVSVQAKTALSNKISGAFRDAYLSSGTYFGWQVQEYPKRNLVIVNVPITERVTSYQFVISTLTGAWSRFKAINSGCWGMLGDAVYWGSHDGKVYKFDSGFLDAGNEAIVAEHQSAFTRFRTARIKHLKMARPMFVGPGNFVPRTYTFVDYDTSSQSLETLEATDSGELWDVADWDVADWAEEFVPSYGWGALGDIGVALSVAFSVSAESELTYNGTDVLYEVGSYL
jgi:hypothetical protein